MFTNGLSSIFLSSINGFSKSNSKGLYFSAFDSNKKSRSKAFNFRNYRNGFFLNPFPIAAIIF